MLKKHILVVSYSQTGQLDNVVKNFIAPLEQNDTTIQITYRNIEPIKPYPFPWDLMTFMDTFPESVHLNGCDIKNFKDDETNYDLVILAYQVWFLSPSIPITAFLKSKYAKQKLQNKPVITLIGCRNMWIMAQEKVKTLLNNIGAKLIDNVVLIDRGNSLETFITTPRWMLTGKTNSLWGMSEAGIDPKQINNTKRFGKAIVEALKNDKEKEHISLLQGLKAVEVNSKLIRSEKIATKSFHIWGNLIQKLGKPGDIKRKPVVILYLMFLLLIIVTVVPINMIVQSILRRTNKDQVQVEKETYEQPSGNGDERMKEFMLDE
ncbi:MAG: dialkylresorcinol condensing enzyme [Arcobacteraceae bacterium]|nr:dialkylresorcinol condensing enzyme [Arcobacteraceae bacterium]